MIAALLRDLRLAVRSVARSPGYAITAVVVLGMALGAATAVYGVVDAFLLGPLPWKDPSSLVILHERQPTLPKMSISYPDFVDWRERSRSWSGLGGFQRTSIDLGGGGAPPEHVSGYRFSAELLPVIGVEPALGRNFLPEEDRQGGPRVVMLGHDYWKRNGADPHIVGKALRVGGEAHTVVGVLPEGFRFYGGELAAVTPLGQLPKRQAEARGSHPGIFALGRLAPGVTLAQARAEMEELGRQLMREHPQSLVEVLPALRMAEEELVSDVRTALLLLLGAVGFVVLIAIANVSSLTLARGLARRKELAIRAALGAGRAALVRQVLVESVFVALCGGLAGILFAVWGVDLLSAVRPASLPPLVEIEVSAAVLAVAIALSVVSGVLAGLLPAISLSEPALNDVLKAGDLGASAGSGGRRARAALVVVEVALAFVLIAGAAMSGRALLRLQAKDPGFDPRNLLTFSISVPPAEYASAEKLEVFRAAVREKLAALPGVESASISVGLPLNATIGRSFDIGGRPPQPASSMPFAVEFLQTPGFLETHRIELLAGRSIESRDAAGTAKVVVIDDVTAKRFFPGEDPIGQRIVSTGGDESWEIVGVARHIVPGGLGEEESSPYQLHTAIAQADPEFAHQLVGMSATLRTSGPPLDLAAAARAAVAQVEPDAPVFDVETMEQIISGSIAAERFSAALLGGFGVFALVLAGVGLFGLVAHGVTRRTREIGVRMALGAPPEAVQRMVLADGLRHVAIGLGIGALGAFALARVLGHLVVGAGQVELPVALASAVVLAGVALLASWLPARRAVRVDPSVALRAE